MFRFWLKWAWIHILDFKSSLKVFFSFFCSEAHWIFQFCYYCPSLFSWDRYSIRRDSLALSIVTGSSQQHNSREKLLCLRQFASVHPGLFNTCLTLYFSVREELVLLHWPLTSVCSHPWLLPTIPLSQPLSPSPADAALVSGHTELCGMQEQMCMWPKSCPVSIATPSTNTALLVLTPRDHAALAVSYRHKAHLLLRGEQKASA